MVGRIRLDDHPFLPRRLRSSLAAPMECQPCLAKIQGPVFNSRHDRCLAHHLNFSHTRHVQQSPDTVTLQGGLVLTFGNDGKASPRLDDRET